MKPGEIIVDSFAGGGGASLGIRWAIGRDPDVAINHDKAAMAMYRANHPGTELYPEDVWHVDPVKACRGRPVGLMWLSPDCTQFSKAKGGKPIKKKLRGLAWTACRWAKAVRPRIIFLENVEEFEDWGPLYRANHPTKKLRNRPNPQHKGRTFKAFVARLRRLGYEVQWRQLRACDLGAPTIRRRLFLIARCDGAPIVWPSLTHGAGRQHPVRVAAECIDWSIPCPSIFLSADEARGLRRKTGVMCIRPLKPATERRIARGMFKFVINNPQPFIVSNMTNNVARGVDEPVSTILSGNHKYLATPFLSKYHAEKNGHDHRATSPSEPVPTLDTSNRFGLVSPYLVPTAHQGDERAHSIDEPVRTITASRRGDEALIAPTLIQRYGERPGQLPRTNSVEKPFNTIVPTGNGADVVQAFLAKHFGGHETPGSSLADSIGTVTAKDHHSLVAVHATALYSAKGQEDRAQSVDAPLRTVTATPRHAVVAAHLQRDFGASVGSKADQPVGTVTPGGGGKTALVTSHLTTYHGTERDGQQVTDPLPSILAQGNHIAEVRAFLVAYYGTIQQTGNLRDPMPTVTSKDRLGLVTVHGVEYAIADIGMRMLQPRELFRAQGFPDTYEIDRIWFDAPHIRRRKGRRYRIVVRRELTKTEKVRMCGNSVPPVFSRALTLANYVAAPASAVEANVA